MQWRLRFTEFSTAVERNKEIERYLDPSVALGRTDRVRGLGEHPLDFGTDYGVVIGPRIPKRDLLQAIQASTEPLSLCALGCRDSLRCCPQRMPAEGA